MNIKQRIGCTILLLITWLQYSTQQCSTATYPKIIGSTNGDSVFIVVDFYQDKIVAAGYTNDNQLRGDPSSTRGSQTPLVVLYQIQVSGEVTPVWHKIVKRSSRNVQQIAVTQDYVICHTLAGIIFTLSLTDGSLVSTRYLSSMDGSAAYFFHTLLLSSDPVDPVAYLMFLNKQTPEEEKKSYSLLKFNILNPLETAPRLNKESYLDDKVKPLWLLFGETEEVLYAFAQHENHFLVSRLSGIDGSAQWSYSFDHYYSPPAMDHAMVSSDRYMIIAVCGNQSYSPMKLGQIIVEYGSVVSHQIYTDSIVSSINTVNLQPRGIKIVDEDNVLMVAIEYSYSYRQFLCYITFSTLSIAYKLTIPRISGLNFYNARFLSNSQFIIPTATQSVFTNANNNGQLTTPTGYNLAQIMSFLDTPLLDDQTAHSCQLYSVTSPYVRSLVIDPDGFADWLGSGNQIWADIDPDKTIKEDTLVSAVVDLDITKLRYNNDFCQQQQTKVTVVGQPRLTYIASVTVDSDTLNKFSITTTCGTPDLNITYTVILTNLNPLPSYIIYDPDTMLLSVTLDAGKGDYYVYLKGTQPDGTFALVGVNIVGTNVAPQFSPNTPFLPNITYILGSGLAYYTLPSYADTEGNSVTLKTYRYGDTTLPSLLNFDVATSQYAINGTKFSWVGEQRIIVNLTDRYGFNNYTFYVIVTNDPPRFTASFSPVSVTLAVNQVQTYTIPSSTDREGHAIITLPTLDDGNALPSFISFTDPLFTFTPTQSVEAQTYKVLVTICDGEPTCTDDSFALIVTNTAPYLAFPLVDQIVPINSIVNYKLPAAMDDEGSSVTVSTDTGNPSFIKFASDTFTISPTLFSEVGTNTIQVKVNDGQLEQSYTFKVTVTNSAPVFVGAIDDQFVIQMQAITYVFPEFKDQEGNTVTISAVQQGSTTLPAFITLTQTSGKTAELYIDPLLTTTAQAYLLDVTLSDGNLFTLYTFTVTVIDNLPPYFLTPLSDHTLKLNDQLDYTLPASTDDELDPFLITYPSPLSWVTYSYPSFHFAPTSFADVKTHQLKVKLSDGFSSSYRTFQVTVTNTAPYYLKGQEPPGTITLKMNDIIVYKWDQVKDEEGNSITMSVVTTGKVGFIQQTGGFEVTMSPIQYSEVGSHSIKVVVADGQPKTTEYPIIVKVTNSAPVFVTGGLFDQSIAMNSVRQYQLPQTFDLEGNPVTISLSPTTAFVNQISSDILEFTPTLFTQVATHVITVYVKDGQPLITTYTFKLTVTNTAPYFLTELEPRLNVRMNTTVIYELPKQQDDEGNPITVSLVSAPSFVKVSADQLNLEFNPTTFKEIDTYSHGVQLSDGQPLSTNYQILITVFNDPPRFVGQKPQNVKLHLNEQLTIDLPLFTDDESNDMRVEHTFLPSFVQFKENKYFITPNQIRHIGVSTVKGKLQDDISANPFSFTIQVVNEPPYFTEGLVEQTVMVGNTITYTLPPTEDKEKLPIRIAIKEQGKAALPSFIKYNSGVLTISPPARYLLTDEQYLLEVTLTDSSGVKQEPPSTLYKLKITVQLDPSIMPPEYSSLTNQEVEDEIKETQEQFQGISQNTSGIVVAPVQLQKIKVQFRALSVTKDANLKLQVYSNEVNALVLYALVQKINRDTFAINLMRARREKVEFNITEKIGNSLIIKLYFNDSKSISQTSEQDEIEIIVNQTVKLTTKTDILRLDYGTRVTTKVPPQMSEETAEIVKKFKDGAIIAATATLPGSIILNFSLSICIQYLWGLLNDLSFLTILTMISMNLPGIAQVIQGAILNFIYLDVLMTDKWLVPMFFNEQDQSEDYPLNETFDQNGFSSMISIKNLGSTFVYLLILLLGYCIYLTMLLLSKVFKRLTKASSYLESKLIWNLPIRFVMQQYPPMLISSFINLYNLIFDAKLSQGQVVASFLSVVVAAFGPISICILSYVLYKHQTLKTLQSVQFTQKYGTLTDGLNVQGHFRSQWNILVMARWTFTSLVLVYFRNSSEIQVIIMLIISVLFQSLLLSMKPMQEPSENVVSLLNEFMVSLYLYIMISLTDFISINTYREECGWMLVSTVFLSLGINIVKFIYTVGKAINSQLIQCRRKRLINKYQSQDQTQVKFKQFLVNVKTPTRKMKVPDNEFFAKFSAEYFQPVSSGSQQMFLQSKPNKQCFHEQFDINNEDLQTPGKQQQQQYQETPEQLREYDTVAKVAETPNRIPEVIDISLIPSNKEIVQKYKMENIRQKLKSVKKFQQKKPSLWDEV